MQRLLNLQVRTNFCLKQQSQSLEYYETLNGAVLTELILADGAFYVGTNNGVVSKFQWVR